jgi:hypothetical protein
VEAVEKTENAKEARWKSSTWIGFRHAESWLQHASTIRRVLVDLPSRRPCPKDATMCTWLTSDIRAGSSHSMKPQVPRLEDCRHVDTVVPGADDCHLDIDPDLP